MRINFYLLASKQPIPASRKAVIYLVIAILAAGTIIFFSGFFTFGAGFIEFIKPEDHSIPLPSPPSAQTKEQQSANDQNWHE